MRIKQTTERRISAAMRIALAALLFLANVAVVILLAMLLQASSFWIYTGLQIMGIATAVWVITRHQSPSYKIGWIFLILALPVAGLILFLLWGGFVTTRRQTLQPKPRPAHKDYELSRSDEYARRLQESYPTWRRLAGYLRKRDFLLYKNTEATYFPTGEAFFTDVLARLERAEQFIFMEYFILAEGKLWDRVFSILRQKAAQGVEIKIIFDDFGNIARMSGEMIDAMKECGIEVAIFNPVHQYVNRLYFNYRDHRKILVVDGQVAYTGGVNLADEYINVWKRFGYWKDGGISLDGDGAWGLTAEFIHMWEMMGRQLRQEHDYYRPHEEKRGEGWCQVFSDGPANNPDDPAEELFLQAISRAKDFVYITTPYLAIEDSMLKALCVAADGGVDVRLLMPGIPDHKYTYLAAGWYFEELLRHGVRLYEFTPGFLHTKAIVADGEMAMVGTVNMDYRSFQFHYECGAVLYGMPAIDHICRDMKEIMGQSREILLEKWLRRGWPRKVVEAVLNLFSIWM